MNNTVELVKNMIFAIIALLAFTGSGWSQTPLCGTDLAKHACIEHNLYNEITSNTCSHEYACSHDGHMNITGERCKITPEGGCSCPMSEANTDFDWDTWLEKDKSVVTDHTKESAARELEILEEYRQARPAMRSSGSNTLKFGVIENWEHAPATFPYNRMDDVEDIASMRLKSMANTPGFDFPESCIPDVEYVASRDFVTGIPATFDEPSLVSFANPSGQSNPFNQDVNIFLDELKAQGDTLNFLILVVDFASMPGIDGFALANCSYMIGEVEVFLVKSNTSDGNIMNDGQFMSFKSVMQSSKAVIKMMVLESHLINQVADVMMDLLMPSMILIISLLEEVHWHYILQILQYRRILIHITDGIVIVQY
jgi:hypothetical protein